MAAAVGARNHPLPGLCHLGSTTITSRSPLASASLALLPGLPKIQPQSTPPWHITHLLFSVLKLKPLEKATDDSGSVEKDAQGNLAQPEGKGDWEFCMGGLQSYAVLSFIKCKQLCHE